MTKNLQASGGIISFDIVINGSKIKDTIEVKAISIDMEVNHIASATIGIQETGMENPRDGSFVHSEGTDFIPGNAIEIALGYSGKNRTVFKGVIVSQCVQVRDGILQLTIICRDKAAAMTKGRYNALFQNNTDSETIKSMVSKYGLICKTDATSNKHAVLMQYNCSDWDYLLMRADVNNMHVLNHQNTLGLKKINFGKKPQYTVEASQDIIDIDLRLDSENIASVFNMSAWDPKTQDVQSSAINIEDALGQGDISATELAEVLPHSSNQYSSAPIGNDEMTPWLKSKATRAGLGKIQGSMRVLGTTKLLAGDLIELSGFSTRFNGKAFVSKVTHHLEQGEWFTTLGIGLSSNPKALSSGAEAMRGSRFLPTLIGTQIATVKQIHDDPDNQYRVLVTLPALKGKGQEDTFWARMAFPYATNGAGLSFFPEIGDEVLLTFMNEDPRYPVITGALYSNKHKPLDVPYEENRFKSIRSKSGITLRFDDEDKVLTIETPSNNRITLDDQGQTIRIEDMHDNALVMDSSGITLKSDKDINLEAKGSVNISADADLAMEAKGDASTAGANITHDAKMSYEAKGQANAKLSAVGQTEIRGAIVMIN